MIFALDFPSTTAQQDTLRQSIHTFLTGTLNVNAADIVSIVLAPGSVIATITVTNPSALATIAAALSSGTFCINSVCAVASGASGSESSSGGGAAPMAAGAGAGVLILILVIVIVVVRRRRGRSVANSDQTSNQRTLPSFETHNPLFTLPPVDKATEDHYQVPVSKSFNPIHLRLGRVLGRGHFGEVYEGVATGIVDGEAETLVAAKVLLPNAPPAQRAEFLDEIRIMGTMSHARVVALLGVCRSEPTILIQELVANGNLKTFLETARAASSASRAVVGAARLLQFAMDIAEGLAYIASLDIVHRDVAARNVLVTCDHRCKIADFGLARVLDQSHYEAATHRSLPIRWLAPEAASRQLFSVASDVWAFGVTLWEICSLGLTPYPGMKNATVLAALSTGYRMPRPAYVSEALYSVLAQAWAAAPADRPSFPALLTRLTSLRAAAATHLGPFNAACFSVAPTNEADMNEYEAPVPQQLFEPMYSLAQSVEEHYHSFLTRPFKPAMDLLAPGHYDNFSSESPYGMQSPSDDANHYEYSGLDTQPQPATDNGYYDTGVEEMDEPAYDTGAAAAAAEEPAYAFGASEESHYAAIDIPMSLLGVKGAAPEPLYSLGQEEGNQYDAVLSHLSPRLAAPPPAEVIYSLGDAETVLPGSRSHDI